MKDTAMSLHLLVDSVNNHCTVEIPPIIRLPFPTVEEPVHASVSIQVCSLEGWESSACALSEAVIGPAGFLFYFI